MLSSSINVCFCNLGTSIIKNVYLNNSIVHNMRIPLTKNNNPNFVYDFLNTPGHGIF